MGTPTVTNGAAYDGSVSREPDATAPFTTAPSMAAAPSCSEPPPLYTSEARAAECPPDSERRSLFRVAQFRVDKRAERDRGFEPARRAERVAERSTQSDAACDDTAQLSTQVLFWATFLHLGAWRLGSKDLGCGAG